MKVYLDMCALKRPFDDQRQGRVLIETAAVTRILEAATAGRLTLCNSAALVAENRRNPNRQRRARVETLLDWVGTPAPRSLAGKASAIWMRSTWRPPRNSGPIGS